MNLALVPAARVVESAEALLHAIHELVRLEEQSQEILKQPVEQLLDGLPNSLDRLEERKTRAMRTVERHAAEYLELRRSAHPGDGASLEALHPRVMQAFRGLERLHRDNERILGLRMTLLSEDLRRVEKSRRFLRCTLQTVAA